LAELETSKETDHMSNASKVLKRIEDEGIEWVDLRFSGRKGK